MAATKARGNGKTTPTAPLGRAEVLAGVSNDAADVLTQEEPFTVRFTLKGAAAILFHRWSDDAVEAKSKAAKGSKAGSTKRLVFTMRRTGQTRSMTKSGTRRTHECGTSVRVGGLGRDA